MPIFSDLTSAHFPNRRGLLKGKSVSVYRGQHPPTHWPEHRHKAVQIVLHLDPAACQFRWKDARNTWQQLTMNAPCVWVLRAGIVHEVLLEQKCDSVVLYVAEKLATQLVEGGLPLAMCVTLGQLGARDVLLLQLAIALREICRDEDEHNPFYVESIGALFAHHALRSLCNTPGNPT